ncbi:MAG: hypothetical protein AAF436_18135 [Myxococcota bacterium]
MDKFQTLTTRVSIDDGSGPRVLVTAADRLRCGDGEFEREDTE